MPDPDSNARSLPAAPRQRPFRRTVLRGLAVVLPPLLTIVIFLWVWNTIQVYVLTPVENGARRVITWSIADIRDSRPASALPDPALTAQVHRPAVRVGQEHYVQLASGQWIPADVYLHVTASPRPGPLNTAEAVYHRYIESRFLRTHLVVPIFLTVFILILYVIGNLLAAGIGRIAWNMIERLINRLPVIRNVYGSVKQVTDFVFSEQEFAYTRVVAVEYPRKGIWSLGFVTGEGMLDIRAAVNEEVLTVFIATSPMPATGYVITIRKREAIDLNITMDQACQYLISCGVVIPGVQQKNRFVNPLAAAVADLRIPAAGGAMAIEGSGTERTIGDSGSPAASSSNGSDGASNSSSRSSRRKASRE